MEHSNNNNSSTNTNTLTVLTDSIPPEASAPQRKALEMLLSQNISFRVCCCEAAVSIDECEAVGKALEAGLVKTLFVANRQLTRFHLVSMPGHKPFITKQFTKGRGVSRVSFVTPELLASMLQTPVGGAGPLSVIADTGKVVEMVIDADITDDWVAVPVLDPTMYAAIRMSDIRDRFLPAAGHVPVVITMED